AAAESVWNETADGLSEIGAELDAAKQQLGDTGDDEAADALAAAADELGRLRDLLNTDPLALWRGGSVDTARLGRLRKQAAAAAELDTIEAEATAAGQRYREAQRAAAALLGRRDELRGLVDAYQIKAARLGAAEDSELSKLYDEAHELLWTAPCDLAAAAAAA